MTRTAHKDGLDLATIRERLSDKDGQDYWRSLNELADTEEFQEYMHREFPEGASELNDGLGRRKFIQLMGASLAFAGLTACTRQPQELIVPYVRAPEQMVPGKPLYFASAISHDGFARGVLVESHMGRPTKIEGNPSHPANPRDGAKFGPTDIFTQATLLDLYDPDRTQVPMYNGQVSTWTKFSANLATEMAKLDLDRGAGLRLLTETVISPTLAGQIEALLKKYPEAKWHQYEPNGRDNVRSGARMAFGEVVETQYDFGKAKRVLSLDSDFTAVGSASVRYAGEFAAGRQVVDGKKSEMSRLYVVESVPSNTGAVADHRLPLKGTQIDGVARSIAQALGIHAGDGNTYDHDAWVDALVKDLKAHQGESLVVVGDQQSPAVHALAHAINHTLGNVGKTVKHTAAVEANPEDHQASLNDLMSDISAGSVSLLVMLGGNPVYKTPADIDFKKALKNVSVTIHLGQALNETAQLCNWHLPESHALEAWSDARAFDGTVSIVQPLIEPLYSGQSTHEVMGMMLGGGRQGYAIVKEFWNAKRGGANFEKDWQTWLHNGLIPKTALASKSVRLKGNYDSPVTASDGMEVSFRLDPTIGDGRYANNGWLQELPKPNTRLTWDNAALLSPATAEKLGVKDDDVIDVAVNGHSVALPVWRMPGLPADTVTVHLGYGRTVAGRVGTGVGVNAYALQTSNALWHATGASISKTGQMYKLACTQDHWYMEGRGLVRSGTLQEYEHSPHMIHEMGHEPGEGHPPFKASPETSFFNGLHTSEEGHAWGMAIDLNACNGCNACTVACQSENNIPVVGKEQVLNGREMHWIRIDRYFKGSLENPEVYNQPVPCMQCENAPCELVCPVGATTHSAEGLNDMAYNRCVGTRYCSNNCPYKVRRFNFLHYSDDHTESLKLGRNPNVTVRGRGVMEKCTYCVQRISAARIESKVGGQELKDGDITTACQGVCPTNAITFGDINDPNSKVSNLKNQKRNYSILAELNTRPRTTYLARLTNPNPEIAQHG
jgi:molybdopterin-containing oxidoreductase family iron-sulfur binding subunit